jgi:hypothetical protein
VNGRDSLAVHSIMRRRVLSVCVGLWLSACTGSVEDAGEEYLEGDAAAAEQRDASQDEPGERDAGTAEREDGGGSGNSGGNGGDGGGAALDAGSARDAASERDAMASDGGARDASPGGNRDASSGNTDASTSVPDAGSNSGRPVFVVAGYRSGIAFSRDLGLTWTTVHGPTGPYADNEYVLSGAAFSNGTFVVAGFDIFSSTDGEHWTERTKPTDQWLGNVNVGKGLFVGVGGYGTSLWSADGISWTKGTMLGSDGFDTAAFGNGTFTASSKDGQWWSSSDGKSWTRLDAESGHSSKIVWCGDHFADEDDCRALVPNGQAAFGENVWIRATHGTNLERSTNNGQSWTDVRVGFEANCVAFGYVP